MKPVGSYLLPMPGQVLFPLREAPGIAEHSRRPSVTAHRIVGGSLLAHRIVGLSEVPLLEDLDPVPELGAPTSAEK